MEGRGTTTITHKCSKCGNIDVFDEEIELDIEPPEPSINEGYF